MNNELRDSNNAVIDVDTVNNLIPQNHDNLSPEQIADIFTVLTQFAKQSISTKKKVKNALIQYITDELPNLQNEINRKDLTPEQREHYWKIVERNKRWLIALNFEEGIILIAIAILLLVILGLVLKNKPL